MNNDIQLFNDWKFKVSAYQMALTIINIDKETVAPPAGSEYRDARSAYLSGELFSLQMDPQMAEVCHRIMNDASADSDLRKEASLNYKEMMKFLSVPKEDYVTFENDVLKSYDAWHEAKNKSDYLIFEPYLLKMIEGKKKLYSYRNQKELLYNQMLDDFEPGMNMEKYDIFFSLIREQLVPLIQKVVSAEPIKDDFLYQYYDPKLQKQWTEEYLLPFLGFDPSWGYQNETEHPFTDWTCENDCRTTTKYLEDNIASSIFSTIHEVGHAWYEHNINPKYDGGILSYGVSSGMHESQSRFCENYLGRSEAFWTTLYPSLQYTFPEQLGNISMQEFVRAINASKPSLVRTEADELTYPLHILVRYEIEKGIFGGTISTDHLNETWNAKYKEILGVDVADDRSGILQDVHWSSGEFGYFPTYALGSAFAAQFYKAMCSSIDVDDLLVQGKYTECIAWLRENIHQYGCSLNADEILIRATGEEFQPQYYIDYLKDKYTKLYRL